MNAQETAQIKEALKKLISSDLGLESEIKRLKRAIDLTQMPLIEEEQQNRIYRRIGQFIFKMVNRLSTITGHNLDPKLDAKFNTPIEEFRSVFIGLTSETEDAKRNLVISLLKEIKKESYEAEKIKLKDEGKSYLVTFYDFIDLLKTFLHNLADKLTGGTQDITKDQEELEKEQGVFIARNSIELFAHLLVSPKSMEDNIGEQIGSGYKKIKDSSESKDHQSVVKEVSSVFLPTITAPHSKLPANKPYKL